MSDFLVTAQSKIKEKQLAFLANEVSTLTAIDTEDEALFQMHVEEALNEYQEGSFPLFSPILAERHQVPFKEHTLRNFREALEDVLILNDEQDNIGVSLVNQFNTVYSEKKRLLERISQLNNLSGDLNLIAGNDSQNTIYLKESFQDASAMDEGYIIDGVSKATISTREGILTLARDSSVDLSKDARIAQITGNGSAGASHVARKLTTTERNGNETERYHFLEEMDKDYHKNPDVLLDSRPDTIFEYELANVPDWFKSERKNYDFKWTYGQKTGERLRLKLQVDLGEVGPINWISLIPYYPYGATGRILLHSIHTSSDGFDYEPLYLNQSVLDQELTEHPQSYQLEELFSGNTDPSKAQHTGQGVWVFPERQARYVEIVLDQDQSYSELLGQAVYYISSEEENYRIQIPEPAELKDAVPGDYIRTLDGKRVTYTKEIQATTEGWRYAIGLRDIHLMRYSYTPKALFVSKRLELDEGEIAKVMLYANEIIPTDYQDIISTMNDWITYEISFDDSNWTRISPSHHEPVNDEFPPKIVEVNGSEIDLASAFQIHKTLIKTDGPATGVRLRIVLSRPEDDSFKFTTPLLEDVALKIEKKGDTI